jgi:hypothetical protein
VASVEHPVSHAIPEFDQRTEERRHVSPSMTGEKARNVLEEDDGRPVSPHKLEEGEGEAGAGGTSCHPVGPIIGASVLRLRATAVGSVKLRRCETPHVAEASSLACDGEVLAREAAGPEGGVLPVIRTLSSAP